MKIPFSNLDSRAWRKLGYVAASFFFILAYIIEAASMVKNSDIRTDYLCFWSAGKVADQYGYSKVYDLEILFDVQVKEINAVEIFDDINVCPVPYPSVFIIPFQLLSKLDLVTSSWLWVTLNWLILIIYMVYFIYQVSSSSPSWGLILPVLALIISYPTISNFVWGQMEVLLLICAGEFIRNSVKKRAFAAGLWIGVLMIKPQLLILIIPALFILRNPNVLKGAFTSGLILFLISFMLSGEKGITSMFELWVGYYPGMAPELMMNWRMVGLSLQSFLPNTGSWIITACGMAGTLVLCWFMIKSRPDFGSDIWILTMMGIFAAACVFTWHSHIHMAMILIPFLVFGIVKKIIPNYLSDYWIFLPPIIMSLFLFILTIRFGGVGPYLLRISPFILRYVYLFLNLIICIYVVRFSRKNLSQKLTTIESA